MSVGDIARHQANRGIPVKYYISFWRHTFSAGTTFSLGNWVSEASPTLGCSIEISGDIYCRYR